MKPWYASKTIYVNLFAFVAAVVQAKYGWLLPPEYEGMFLGVVNVFLRTITSEGLSG